MFFVSLLVLVCSGGDWKSNLKLPAKDTRKKTEVSNQSIFNVKTQCLQ